MLSTGKNAVADLRATSAQSLMPCVISRVSCSAGRHAVSHGRAPATVKYRNCAVRLPMGVSEGDAESQQRE